MGQGQTDIGRVCGDEAGPAACIGPVYATGLCHRHYQQVNRGQPLDPGERQIGDPSGYGRWGLLDPDPDDPDRVVCHDCGRTYVALGVHITRAHDAVRDYRLRHGLLMGTPLAGPGLSARLADAARPSVDRISSYPPPRPGPASRDLIRRGAGLARAHQRARPNPQ